MRRWIRGSVALCALCIAAGHSAASAAPPWKTAGAEARRGHCAGAVDIADGAFETAGESGAARKAALAVVDCASAQLEGGRTQDPGRTLRVGVDALFSIQEDSTQVAEARTALARAAKRSLEREQVDGTPNSVEAIAEQGIRLQPLHAQFRLARLEVRTAAGDWSLGPSEATFATQRFSELMPMTFRRHFVPAACVAAMRAWDDIDDPDALSAACERRVFALAKRDGLSAFRLAHLQARVARGLDTTDVVKRLDRHFSDDAAIMAEKARILALGAQQDPPAPVSAE